MCPGKIEGIMTSTSPELEKMVPLAEASTSSTPNHAGPDDDCLTSAFKKLKVDPQWSEDSLVNDVSTEALRDLWAGKSSKTRSRAKLRGLKSRKKHRKSSKMPYNIDNLPCMDKLTLSQEKCSCSSCTKNVNDNPFGLSSAADLGSKSLVREARLKLHHSQKDRKSVIWKAKLSLRKQESRSPPGANAFIPDVIFGAKSKLDTFSDVKAASAAACSRDEFKSAPVFSDRSDHTDELSDSIKRVKISQKRREPRLHRTCSQEAKLDEMTVDELAGYLEDFVYLPKKMSDMAEMMYT